ncbi:uncharacterized protein [Dermacentor andersoni]|uniref:uncharacterized protein n=1 Tax=Dermacentor andersoni TaxID=34620 RepID=UPI002155A30D|nr:uncharacterized protein LOC126527325 [Dermacentor andersoni]
MLLRLSVLLATCALSMTAEQEDNPFPTWLIEAGSHTSEADTAIVSTRKPRVTGKVRGGTACLNTEECGIGKCCLRRSKDPRRRCRRFQRAGERCTDEQMMGGYYYGHCPCNKHSDCTPVRGVLKCVRKQVGRPTAPGTRPQNVLPEDTGKESKESDELPKRLAPPPKKPNFNETKLEFPEIPEFFKTFAASDNPAPATVPPEEGGGEEGGGEEGGEGGEEEGLPNGAEDLPEDITPTSGGGTEQHEPPETSNEGAVETTTTVAHALQPSGGGGGMSAHSMSHPVRPGSPRLQYVGLPGSRSVPQLPPPPTLHQ